MAGKIFVNYRRGDVRDAAARLRDKLAAALGKDEVFMDVDNLLAGERFDLKLKEALACTEVFVAVIGPRWLELLEARMESGERDYVREEIATALAAGVPVIPVLMDRAPLPKAASLPEDIRELVLYHAHGIAYESFGRDVHALIEAIEVHRRTRARAAGEAARRAAEAERQAREETARLAAGKERAAREAARLAREREVAEAARLAQAKRQAEAEARRLPDGARGDAEGSPWKSFAIVLAVLAAIGGGIQVYRWSRPPEPGLVPNPALAQPFKPAPAPVVLPRGETCDGVPVAVAAGGKQCIKPGSGQSFKDCETCPEMVLAPAGSFTMGSPDDEKERSSDESPQHPVTFEKPFAVGRFAVTFDEWAACAEGGGCASTPTPSDSGWGKGTRPVINVSWNDAQEYVRWLSKKTGKAYRLLSEAEREYVTRAGTDTPFWWGSSITPEQANYDGNYTYAGGGKAGEYRKETLPVKSFKPNAWGLYQVHGNVWEWVEDCWHGSYHNAPSDGSAWLSGACSSRVFRGGSWIINPQGLRAARRSYYIPRVRSSIVGFRVAAGWQDLNR